MSPVVLQQDQIDQAGNLADVFGQVSVAHPVRVAYSHARDTQRPSGELERAWFDTTYNEARNRVEALGGFLESIGVQRGVRVTILSNTRPEWGEAELAVYAAGGSVVTAYPSDPAARNGYVIFDSGSRIVIVENQEQLEKIAALASNTFEFAASEGRPVCRRSLEFDHVIAFEKVEPPREFRTPVTQLSKILEGSAASSAIWERVRQLARGDEATVLYTSGTTGAPKGVIATHGQHLSNLRQCLDSGLTDSVDSFLHILPESHAFGLRMCHLSWLTGVKGIFPAVPNPRSSELSMLARASIARDMASANADVIPAVPKMLERMRAGVLQKVSQMSGFRRELISKVIASYSRVYDEREGGAAASRADKRLHAFFDRGPLRLGRRISEKVRGQLVGGRFKFFITGGAKLPRDVGVFFGALGMPACEGYGSTETNVPVAVNTVKSQRLGSVGRKMSGDIQLKLSPEGELLVRGPNVAAGYLGRALATAERWDDQGWYHTRDRAEIDGDGFLYIRGRVDDAMKTLTGEFIQPDPIEAVMKGASFVSEAVLVGEDRPCCVALVTLNEEAVRRWLLQDGVDAQGCLTDDARVAQAVREQVTKAVERAGFRKFEFVKHVGVIPELTIGAGLTPTFKVQRRWVVDKYADLIERLYGELRESGLV